MTLPVKKKTDTYSELPWKVRLIVTIVVYLLNKLNDQLEPYNMAPYFCINSYEESDVEEVEDIIKH